MEYCDKENLEKLGSKKHIGCFPFWNPEKQKMEKLWVGRLERASEYPIPFDPAYIKHLIKKQLPMTEEEIDMKQYREFLSSKPEKEIKTKEILYYFTRVFIIKTLKCLYKKLGWL